MAFLRFSKGRRTSLRLLLLSEVLRYAFYCCLSTVHLSPIKPRAVRFLLKSITKQNGSSVLYWWFFHFRNLAGVEWFHESIMCGLTCLPAYHGTLNGNSTPQMPNFYGQNRARKQDVSHFASRWITTKQRVASYLQARPGRAPRWLTRPLSKPASPNDCGLELGPFATITKL